MPAERADSMQPPDDILLGVLDMVGGSGTNKSIVSTFEKEENARRILRKVPDDAQDIELDSVDVNHRLWTLRGLGLVDYLGHGEFKITERGRDYYSDEGEIECASINTGWRRKLSKEAARRGQGIIISLLSVIGILLFLNATATDICQLGIGASLVGFVILPITILLALFHLLDIAKPLNIFLINRLSIVRNERPGDDEVSSGDIDASAAAISNSFRSYTVLGLCILLASGTLFATHFTISTQVYGLIFDLFGGVFLAFQAIHASRGQLRSSGRDLAMFDFGAETVEVTDGVWGIFFLIIGFSIQGLAQIPWTAVLRSLFGTVPGVC